MFEKPDLKRTHVSLNDDTLEGFEFTSDLLGNTRRIEVYLPAGYDAGTAPLPLSYSRDIERPQGLVTVCSRPFVS